MPQIAAALPAQPAAAPRKPWYKILYVQVLIAIVLGALVGWLFPDFAKNDWIKALGDGFVKLIRMVIAPIIFCTVVSGIAHIIEVKKVGRVAVKALVYFEVVSSFALALGLIVANVLQPGAGFSGKTDAAAVAAFAKQASEMKSVDFVLHIIPDSAVGSFCGGRHPAGAAVFGPVRVRADGARRSRQYAALADRRFRAHRSSASSPSSSKRRRSAPSAPWPIRSADMVRPRSAISPA